MAICAGNQFAMKASEAGALLYVTDLISDSQDRLDFACEWAEAHGVQLELLHVVDLELTPSSPDAQTDVQYRLETLACNLRSAKREPRAVLLFGHPEDVISKRSVEIKARLIALPFKGSATECIWKGLAKRLSRRCTCPVVWISPPFMRRARSDSLRRASVTI